MYTPRSEECTPTPCQRKGCTGHVVGHWKGGTSPAYFTCSRKNCNWTCGIPKPRKKRKTKPQSYPRAPQLPPIPKVEVFVREPQLTKGYKKTLTRLLREGKTEFLIWAATDKLAKKVAAEIGVKLPKPKAKTK